MANGSSVVMVQHALCMACALCLTDTHACLAFFGLWTVCFAFALCHVPMPLPACFLWPVPLPCVCHHTPSLPAFPFTMCHAFALSCLCAWHLVPCLPHLPSPSWVDLVQSTLPLPLPACTPLPHSLLLSSSLEVGFIILDETGTGGWGQI